MDRQKERICEVLYGEEFYSALPAPSRGVQPADTWERTCPNVSDGVVSYKLCSIKDSDPEYSFWAGQRLHFQPPLLPVQWKVISTCSQEE